MKNKIFDFFLIIGNILFLIGVVITSIFVIRNNNQNALGTAGTSTNPFLLFLPLIIFTFISIILFCLYYWNKRTNLILVKMHVNFRWIFIHYISGLILVIGILLSVILMWVSNFVTTTVQNTWYFYFVIAVTILFLIISYGLDSYSRFRVSIDIIKRKLGEEFTMENGLISLENINDFNSISDNDFSKKYKKKKDFIDFVNKPIVNDVEENGNK